MSVWEISLGNLKSDSFSSERHEIVAIPDFLKQPNSVIEFASLQKFAKITPQYPGVRAQLPDEVCSNWADKLSPMLGQTFGENEAGWDMIAWYSLVTARPDELIPLQCFPHVDGTDPNQLAMMLYLHDTQHGGTAFFRHLATGLISLSEATFPQYRDELQKGVQRTGLPPRRYVTDGAPLFERVHVCEGAFNQAVFYRGNILHSGVIDNDAPLSPDPRKGRLTINAFFRPK